MLSDNRRNFEHVGVDHAKISKNSCISNKKELTSSREREFPKLTYWSLFGPNSR